ncbi:MAG: hypothetical protein WA628_25895 [Terriglobales bacterium]
MNYLSPAEYESYGLESTTPAAWVAAASAVMDAHCRRATLGVAQYTERLRVFSGRNTVRLTYLPLTTVAPTTSPLISARGRYAMPRRGEWPYEEMSASIACAFGLPGQWNELSVADLDACTETGELSLPVNALGLGFSEIEVVYTAGLPTLPAPVKVACAQIVRNAQSTPALNVRRGRLDQMYLDYFSDSLLDETVRELLAPYVAQKAG